MTAAQLLSVGGLSLDLVGALFIGYEVLNRYRGEVVQRKGGIEHIDVDLPELAPAFIEYEARKHKVMAIGLSLLATGFLLQILGVVLT